MPSKAPRLPDLRTDSELRERFAEYLREHWPGGAEVTGLTRADGGFSNETWLLDLAGGESVVLRRQALVGPLEPYDLERESAVLKGLRQLSDVPVPEVYLYCGDASVLGSPFTLIERLDGDVPDYRSLPEYPPWAEPGNRTAMAEEVIRALSLIQAARWDEEPLASLLAPDHPDRPPVVGRVLGWLAKLDDRVGRHALLPVLRDTAAWLVENAPESDERVMVHGDFRVGNFIWHGTQLTAVLDWEGAGVGDPFEDLGYMCHPMARVRDPSLMGMLVPIEEMCAIFEARMGRPVDMRRVHYYLIFALFFHLSTLVLGYASARDGADLRAGLGYSKFARVTRELIEHMNAYERGSHVL